MDSSSSSSSIAIPISIVFGFGMIALAIYFSGVSSSSSDAPQPQNTNNNQQVTQTSENIRPVDETDYIRGNPNAPIMIVEYSDYDCPFCSVFHQTMKQIMDEYGVTGEVGWVYRQFPVRQLHPNAPFVSEAALCVGELGGNDAFWTFSDLVFEDRETNEPTKVLKLPEYAVEAGVSEAEYTACVESGRHREAVEASIEDGFNAGVRGTPNSFVIIGNQQASIEGAQPYTVVKNIVEDLIGQLEGRAPTEIPEGAL